MTGVLPVPAQPDAACSTCLEPLTDDVVRMVKCGHMFHCTCILPWFQSRAQRRGSCPNCRADFEPEPLRVPHTPIRHAPLPYTPVPLTPAPYTPVPHTPTSYRHLSRTLLPYARSPNTHIHFGYRLDSGDIGREAPVPPHSILPRQRMIEIRERVQISREHDIIQREIAQSERMRGPSQRVFTIFCVYPNTFGRHLLHGATRGSNLGCAQIYQRICGPYTRGSLLFVAKKLCEKLHRCEHLYLVRERLVKIDQCQATSQPLSTEIQDTARRLREGLAIYGKAFTEDSH